MPDTRLIERWLPIAEIGEESTRERRSLQALPSTYYLHVWWARRPLVASRAAVLASLLPANADREQFLHILGIHGDPVAAQARIAKANRTGERLGADAYGYPRAFRYTPAREDRVWLEKILRNGATVLDPTAGGGSIAFEALRLGVSVHANDLNPVAALIERATVDWPASHGLQLKTVVEELGGQLVDKIREHLSRVFPEEPEEDTRPDGYLWARTVTCPYCDGQVPLSPNWRLAPDGTGVRLLPDCAGGPRKPGRACAFEIVDSAEEQFPGTVARGDGHCPYDDCERVVDGDEIKRQAQAGRMGEQLFAVVYKRRVPGKVLKSGKRGRDKWVRGYRAPRPEDDNSAAIRERLAKKLPEWEALDIVPSERIPDGNKTTEPHRYGMPLWRDLFSPRQLLCHGTSVEVFREMLDADRAAGRLNELREAAYGYLALAIDKSINWNARIASWNVQLQSMRSVFDRHDFSFKWSYAEAAPLITGLGYDWTIAQTAKCIGELVSLVRPKASGDSDDLLAKAEPQQAETPAVPPVTITCKAADSLDHLVDGSIDAVVMDPPYYDNVMYAELSDFFYVWLKRTAGRVFPELFRRQLTDKENEAVANPAKFRDQKGARARAGRDYQERMAAIFAECRRVLKPDGIMTLMFTHKATGAWDALTTGLMDAGFAITASWPINTEAGGSLHIRDKAAANSTIFLACRPRPAINQTESPNYWEDVEPKVAGAVRKRVKEFQDAGIGGVDLFLAAFGPALEEFSRHWPLRRGEPRDRPQKRRGQQKLLEEPWDPYAVSPEDALDVARREVKRWRLERLTHLKANADLDPVTAFFVLAWDTFRAPSFDYDEALRLARAVGIDLDQKVTGRLAHKSGSNLQLWDSARRAATGGLGPADGSRGMIDTLHHAAHVARLKSLTAARELLDGVGVDQDPRFFAALEAVLEVLPMSSEVTGIKLTGDVGAAGNDFEALYKLSRLAYSEQVDEPDQLTLWRTSSE